MAQAMKEQGYRFQCPNMNLSARPNVYKRSLEARETTNAYLAEVERKAAGMDEPEEQDTANSMRLYKALAIGLAVLLLVAVAVGMVML